MDDIQILGTPATSEDSDIVEVEAVSRPRHSQSSATHHLPTTSSSAFRPNRLTEPHPLTVSVTSASAKMMDSGRKSIPAQDSTTAGRRSIPTSLSSVTPKQFSPLPQPKPPQTHSSSQMSVEHADHCTQSRVRELLTAMRRYEVQELVKERDRAFVQMIDYLLKRKLYPDAILEHRPYSDEMEEGVEFRCSWCLNGDQVVEGWLDGKHLQQVCPERLAEYFTRLRAPSSAANYRSLETDFLSLQTLSFPKTSQMSS